MIVPSRFRATIDDLYKVEGKAELVAGKVVPCMSTGRRPGRIGGRIYLQLMLFVGRTGRGEPFPDNVGYALPAPLANGRESFSPDVSYYDGPDSSDDMRFIDGAPTFAVEVRSENDYGPAAERDMAAKRADYFEAGTLVVWDVDAVAETIACYRDAAGAPTIFVRGDVADAEPAVPGWRLSVAELFA